MIDWTIFGLQISLYSQTLDGTSIYSSELFIHCVEGDKIIWKTESILGAIFIVLHTVTMMTSAMQVKTAFYQILNKTSYFEGL